MSVLKKGLMIATMAIGSYTGSAFALFGIGGHYSLDFSVKMDAAQEQLTFDSLKLSTTDFTGSLPPGFVGQSIGPSDIPIYFDRGKMLRTPFGLGGKIYVDIVPFIDCIELGGDFVGFQYDGKIRYPSSIDASNPTIPSDATPEDLLELAESGLVKVQYDTISLNLEDNGVKVPGVTKTPFIKLDLNLTIRKYIWLPPVIKEIIRPYGGAGFVVTFATPVPSAGLVNDAIGEDLSGEKTIAEVVAVMGGEETSNKIINTVLERLFTPHFGMSIVLGFMVKPPVVPIALYIHGKYMIPFGKLDDDANVTAMGFKLNAGLALHFGKKK